MLTAYTPSTQENLQMRSLFVYRYYKSIFEQKVNNNDNSYVRNLPPQKKCCHNQYFFYLPVVQGTTCVGK